MTLGTTTLVHDAYLSMTGTRNASFLDRARFFAYASRAMRGLVVDYARRGHSGTSSSRLPRRQRCVLQSREFVAHYRESDTKLRNFDITHWRRCCRSRF